MAVEAGGSALDALESAAIFERRSWTHLCSGRSQEAKRLVAESQQVPIAVRIQGIHGV